MYGRPYNGLLAYANIQQHSNNNKNNISIDEVVDDIIDGHEHKADNNLKLKIHNDYQLNLKSNKKITTNNKNNNNNNEINTTNTSNNFDEIINSATTYKNFIKSMNSPARPTTVKNFLFSENSVPASTLVSPKSLVNGTESFEKYEKLNYKQKLTKKLADNQKSSSSSICSLSRADEYSNDRLKLLKYELKEKDLDIVELQKEINELQLENRIIKAKMPIHFGDQQSGIVGKNDNNPYVKEILLLRKENECLVDELNKLQDAIGQMKHEKAVKSIELYDPNNPDFLQKKIKNFEKQVQNLEDENEKYINELSQAESTIEKFKMEIENLKIKLSKSQESKREDDEKLIHEVNSLKIDIKKLKTLNQQLLDENKKLITNTISVNKRLMNDMHSKDLQYQNEGKMSSQKRQEEVFAEEIRNLRKEINTLSSIQTKSHSPQEHHHHHSKSLAHKNTINSNNHQKKVDCETQYDYRRKSELEANNKFRPNSDEDSESTQYLTTYKTILTTSKPQVNSFSPKSQSLHEQESKMNSDNTDLVRSSSNLSNVSNLSNSSDSTIRITTKISTQHPSKTTSTSTKIKSLDDYLISNFRPFQQGISNGALRLNDVNASSPKSIIQISHMNNYSQPSSVQANADEQKYMDYFTNLRLSLQNVNETVNETNDYKTEKHFTDLEVDADDNFEKLNGQIRSRSADLISSRKKKIILRKENEFTNNDLIKDIMAKKKPFVPMKPQDIHIDDVVKFSRPSGKITKGIVKYIGMLPERSDVYLGLELDIEDGKHDGVYQSKRYFQSRPNKGVFVSFSKVVMAWGSNN